MTVEDLQREVATLPPNDVARLAAWIAEYHAQLWDEQIEADLNAGRLDGIIQQADDDIAAGRSKPL